MDLLIATANPGKVTELRELLVGLPATIYGLADLKIADEIIETGSSFAENAILKAAGYARIARMPAIADDSGLEIDSLGGAPGVLSARWAGKAASDRERVEKVLAVMEAVPDEARSARFVCVAAFADAAGNILHSATGVCTGKIAMHPRGKHGFGYDPIFQPTGHELTFGELARDVKLRISHRSDAISKIMPFLQGFFGV